MYETKEHPAPFGGANIKKPIVLRGAGLSINEVVQVARFGAAAPEAESERGAGHDQRHVRHVRHCRQLYLRCPAAAGPGHGSPRLGGSGTAGQQSILLSFFGNSLVDRFPTHAEQFNQNINSLGLGSARLARQTIKAFDQYMAVVLMFGVQAADLRTHRVAGHYDARQCLSPATLPLYEAVREVVAVAPSAARPYIRNDNEQAFSEHIQRIAEDIAGFGRIPRSVENLLTALDHSS